MKSLPIFFSPLYDETGAICKKTQYNNKIINLRKKNIKKYSSHVSCGEFFRISFIHDLLIVLGDFSNERAEALTTAALSPTTLTLLSVSR